MTLPAGARVRATRSFAASQRALLAFMLASDPASAATRYASLLVELQQAHQRLSWAPASGRPAHFLAAASLQGQAMARRAQQLAHDLGAPELREVVLKHHLLLYAHSDRDVYLLALKHERQLAYGLPGDKG